MEKTKYLSLMSDEQIKKTAQKFCNSGYVAGLNRNHNAKSYKIQRNKDNVIVTMKCPKINRLSIVVMTDYDITIVEQGLRFDYGQTYSFPYTKFLANIFGEDYKNDLIKQEKEKLNSLQLKSYLDKVTDEDVVDVLNKDLKSGRKRYDILENSLQIVRPANEDKIVAKYMIKQDPTYYTIVELSSYYLNEYSGSDKNGYDLLGLTQRFQSIWHKKLTEIYGKEYLNDYKKYVNYEYEKDKAVLKYAYDKNAEYIKKHTEGKEQTIEIDKLKSSFKYGFDSVFLINNFVRNNILDQKLVKKCCYVWNGEKEEYLAKTDYEEKFQNELNDIFENTKTEEMEKTL